MENVVLTIHLILALLLIGVVLLQRSEGGGLGMGGGGGGAMSGRAAATALAKLTWIFAGAFICTSIALTVIAAQKSAGTSVVDQFGGTPPRQEAPAAPDATDLLPPVQTDAPLAPPRPDAAPEGTAPAAPPSSGN
jgi:preprotein translocase subunit SecG